ncbi:MAG TPA: CocE/NonD family hydrolase, partial [Gemmatimonadaceae bacterium]|nr:CocE/NonD family hydrolase [Gemmatimonadaceae bacterium]
MLKRIVLGIVGLVVGLVVAVLVLAAMARDAGDVRVPAGMRRNQALYVPMRDGEQIAIDVWYPATLASGQRIPALIKATRYVRATRPGLLARAAITIGQFSSLDRRLGSILDAGYAVVLVDARGSGASTGRRAIEWSPEELADYGEIVDWIVKQPWSNGRVGAWGGSYEGNTAEMLAATGRRAVKGVAPLYDDYNPPMDLAMPGGVLLSGFLAEWG